MGNGTMEKLTDSRMDVRMDDMNELIAYKQDSLRRLQGEVLAEQANLNKVKQDIDDAKRQAKYDANVEREKFLKSLEHEKEVIQAERKQLESLDIDINSRRKEVEILEAQAAPIKAAMAKLQDERLSIEQQRIRNEELKRDNDALANSTSVMHEEVVSIRAELLAKEAKVNQRLIEQEQQQVALDKLSKDLQLQEQNILEIRKTIDPKLAEVTKRQEQAEKDLTQANLIRESITKQQAETDKQKADLAILSSQLKAKSDALAEYDSTLKRTETELRIKLQQAKSQGVDIKLKETKDGG